MQEDLKTRHYGITERGNHLLNLSGPFLAMLQMLGYLRLVVPF